MNVAAGNSGRWLVSARSGGEALFARYGEEGAELLLVGLPAGFGVPETESWLRDVLSVARETASAAASEGPIPVLLHHVLTGLLFSHAEVWSTSPGITPGSLVFVAAGRQAGFGFVGDAVPEVWLDGHRVEVGWVRVRDERGFEARAFSIESGHALSVSFTWSDRPNAPGADSIRVAAEWMNFGAAVMTQPPAPAAAITPAPVVEPVEPIEPAAAPYSPEPAAAPLSREATTPSAPEPAFTFDAPSWLSTSNPVANASPPPSEALAPPPPAAVLRALETGEPVAEGWDTPAPDPAPMSDIATAIARAAEAETRASHEDEPVMASAPAPAVAAPTPEGLLTREVAPGDARSGASWETVFEGEPAEDESGKRRAGFFAWIGGLLGGKSRQKAEDEVYERRFPRRAPAPAPAPEKSLFDDDNAATVVDAAIPLATSPAPETARSELIPPTPEPAELTARTVGWSDAVEALTTSETEAPIGAPLDSIDVPSAPTPIVPPIGGPPRLDLSARASVAPPASDSAAPLELASPFTPIEPERAGDSTAPVWHGAVHEIPASDSAPILEPVPPPAPPAFVPPPAPPVSIAPPALASPAAPAFEPVTPPAPAAPAFAPLTPPAPVASEFAPAAPSTPMAAVVEPAIAPPSPAPVVAPSAAAAESAPIVPHTPILGEAAARASSLLEGTPPADAGRPARRLDWEAEEPKKKISFEGWQRPAMIAAGVLALFLGGWIIGGIQDSRSGRQGGFSKTLRALGFGGARYELTVNSRPPGAWIAVDGKDLARRTPATIDLKPGLHQVTLSLSDLGASTFEVRGERGEHVPLDAPLWGSLRIGGADLSLPITVTLDGESVGYVPVELDSVLPGAHEVRFSGPGMATWGQTVRVRIGERAEVIARPMSSPATGLIEVRASFTDEGGTETLNGAEVWVDGQRRGATPLTLELDRGPHSVRVQYQGETAPVQVIDLPGGNQRFANFEFGLGADRPTLNVVGDVSRISIEKPAVISASLSSFNPADVREMWLHVKTADGGWRRYEMSVMKATGATVGVAVYPPAVVDGSGRARWYVSAVANTGDEFFTEIQTSEVVAARR